MEIFSLDTSCVLNLLNTNESVDQDLINLLRFGFNDVVKLVVTEQLSKEVKDNAGNKRPEIVERIGILPVHSVSQSKQTDRDSLAQDLFQCFWPNAKPSSKNTEHSHRDCLHLASHKLCGGNVFVTRDEQLLKKVLASGKKFDLVALSPAEAVTRIQNELPLVTGVKVASPVIRCAELDDKDSLKTLLEPMKNSYLDFDGWLNKTLNDKKAIINLAAIGNSPISAVAIWKKKDKLTVKLSLFYVAPDSRQIGLGQHLLFYCLREWIKNRFEKVVVTTSEQNAELLNFFTRYGFRIEGISQRRYQRSDRKSSSELILTKYFFYQRITEVGVSDFIDELATTVFSVPDSKHIKNNQNWFIPPKYTDITPKWPDEYGNNKLLLCYKDQEINSLSIPDLEQLLYPLRFAFNNRQAYLIPIQPRWANQMIQVNGNQTKQSDFVSDKLFLRTDNVYYCYPWYSNKDVVGAPILFYISSPDSMIGGMGYILERRIAIPEELFLEFGGLGVYQISNIQEHTKQNGSNKGCAMALKFGWWVPFPKPVPLSDFNNFNLNGCPQHMQSISYAQYEQIMKEGGLEW